MKSSHRLGYTPAPPIHLSTALQILEPELILLRDIARIGLAILREKREQKVKLKTRRINRLMQEQIRAIERYEVWNRGQNGIH